MFVNDAAFDPHGEQPRQYRDWSCAACSLAWVNRAMGIDRATTEDDAIALIGTPHNINAAVGLTDGSGERLRQLLVEDRGAAFRCWPSFWQAVELAEDHVLLLGGANWYHWVAVRFAANARLWIANSAPGWRGVYHDIGESEFGVLGPFACVAVPLHVEFPPPDEG